MQWDDRQRPILPAGTVLRFRDPGLKKKQGTNPPRYYRIEQKLGQGRLCVYRVRPVEPVTGNDRTDPVTEKRKRTETTESERVADLLAPTVTALPSSKSTSTKAPKGKGVRFVKKSKATTALAPSVSTTTVAPPNSSTRSAHPLATSTASDHTRLRPVGFSDAEDSGAALPFSSTTSYHTALPASTTTSTPTVFRSVSTASAAPPASSTKAELGSVHQSVPDASPTPVVPPAVNPPALSTASTFAPSRSVPTAISATSDHAIGSTTSEAGGWVPIGESQAIKFAYIPGSKHRSIGHRSFERLGQLGDEFDNAMEIGGSVIVMPLMCGWVEILLPEGELWMVGLFTALLMPLYQDLSSLMSEGVDMLPIFTKGISILAKFHRLGYVHCDLKPENILARRQESGEYEVVLADLEGAVKAGSKVTKMFCTWDFMPLSVFTHFMLQTTKLPEVRRLLDKALPDVIDAGVDFWAYGVMILEYYCPIFFDTLQITHLMQQVMERDGAGDGQGALSALEQVRKSFVQIYDKRAYEDELNKHSLHLIQELLSFCLQRPSNIGLYGTNERDFASLTIGEGEGDGDGDDSNDPRHTTGATTTRATSDGGNDPRHTTGATSDDLRYPVSLPWGNCTLTRSGTKWVIDVPGVLDDPGLIVYDPCSPIQAVGCPDCRIRYICGGEGCGRHGCNYVGWNWIDIVKHVERSTTIECVDLKMYDR